MESDGVLVLLGRRAAWRMEPRPGAFDDVRALDGAWLETTLEDVEVQTPTSTGSTRCSTRSPTAGPTRRCSIRPVSVAEIERTAREGLLMPPKSTFFTPKLKTGVVLRPLEG